MNPSITACAVVEMCPETTAERAPGQLCREVAQLFGVQEHEVALLRIEGPFLRFVYPPPLAKVGRLPLSHSSAIAVRTALQRKPELFNHFPAVKHASVFESVPLGYTKPDQIQKLMSVPLVRGHEVVGVLQVCRKASNPGPDFVYQDLQRLTQLVHSVTVMFDEP